MAWKLFDTMILLTALESNIKIKKTIGKYMDTILAEHSLKSKELYSRTWKESITVGGIILKTLHSPMV